MTLGKTLVIAGMFSMAMLHAGNYTVDSDHSDVGFKVKHMMISTVKGNFQHFNGTFTLDEKTKHFTSMVGVVDVETLSTQNKKRDEHLRSADFFDAKKYPHMSLKLIEQRGDKASVQLTIKDVTKTIMMDLEEINGPAKDPWGNVRSAFELHGKINRKDFNINFNKLLETGGLLVGDTVKLDISIEGIKEK